MICEGYNTNNKQQFQIQITDTKKKKKNEDPNNSSVERSFSGTTRNTNHDFQFHTPNNVTQPAIRFMPQNSLSL
jgi:hypothetical protein